MNDYRTTTLEDAGRWAANHGYDGHYFDDRPDARELAEDEFYARRVPVADQDAERERISLVFALSGGGIILPPYVEARTTNGTPEGEYPAVWLKGCDRPFRDEVSRWLRDRHDWEVRKVADDLFLRRTGLLRDGTPDLPPF